jgi:hypothetical protein
MNIEEIISSVTGYWPSKESTNVVEEQKLTPKTS